MRVTVVFAMLFFMGNVCAQNAPQSLPHRLVNALLVYECDDAVWVFAEEAQTKPFEYDGPETMRLHVWIIDREGLKSEHHFRSSLGLTNSALSGRNVTTVFQYEGEVFARQALTSPDASEFFRLEERGFVSFTPGRQFVQKFDEKSLTHEELLDVSKNNGLANIGSIDPVLDGVKLTVKAKRLEWNVTLRRDGSVVARKDDGKHDLVLLELHQD